VGVPKKLTHATRIMVSSQPHVRNMILREYSLATTKHDAIVRVTIIAASSLPLLDAARYDGVGGVVLYYAGLSHIW